MMLMGGLVVVAAPLASSRCELEAKRSISSNCFAIDRARRQAEGAGWEQRSLRAAKLSQIGQKRPGKPGHRNIGRVVSKCTYLNRPP